MDIDAKLQRFSDVVLKEAGELNKKQASLMDEKYDINVSDFERKTAAKYDEMYEEAELTAEKQKQAQIARKNAELKKALIQKRKEYTDIIFENIFKRLNDFFKTPEYEKLIIDSINGCKDGSSEEISAVVMDRDIRLKDSIEKSTGVKVVATEEDFLGGCRVRLGKNRLADLTLKRRFEAEKSGFNKIRI